MCFLKTLFCFASTGIGTIIVLCMIQVVQSIPCTKYNVLSCKYNYDSSSGNCWLCIVPTPSLLLVGLHNPNSTHRSYEYNKVYPTTGLFHQHFLVQSCIMVHPLHGVVVTNSFRVYYWILCQHLCCAILIPVATTLYRYWFD